MLKDKQSGVMFAQYDYILHLIRAISLFFKKKNNSSKDNIQKKKEAVLLCFLDNGLNYSMWHSPALEDCTYTHVHSLGPSALSCIWERSHSTFRLLSRFKIDIEVCKEKSHRFLKVYDFPTSQLSPVISSSLQKQ